MQLSSKYIISIALSAQILLPFSRDPKKVSPGSSLSSPVRRDPVTQDVAAQSSAVATRCCVIP
ncbi:hypothetical protein RYZ99_24115, partial [Salmonella enterica subsp. enterica serovar Enteritidis]|nr:hypothetical protein [Salmonella enterica subsp. enterica serovar Enteritidis]MDW2478006.1 hypothetical protein [Salmonella enterica subsp. enterica serovar Enteritidis]